jgi:hypothetical protein
MASADRLLENGVTSTTEPSGIVATPPPGAKKDGTAAWTLA